MATDLERFKELYASLGITFEDVSDEDEIILKLTAKTHPKVRGYSGFSTWIHFNKEGNFLHQDFWE